MTTLAQELEGQSWGQTLQVEEEDIGKKHRLGAAAGQPRDERRKDGRGDVKLLCLQRPDTEINVIVVPPLVARLTVDDTAPGHLISKEEALRSGHIVIGVCECTHASAMPIHA